MTSSTIRTQPMFLRIAYKIKRWRLNKDNFITVTAALQASSSRQPTLPLNFSLARSTASRSVWPSLEVRQRIKTTIKAKNILIWACAVRPHVWGKRVPCNAICPHLPLRRGILAHSASTHARLRLTCDCTESWSKK